MLIYVGWVFAVLIAWYLLSWSSYWFALFGPGGVLLKTGKLLSLGRKYVAQGKYDRALQCFRVPLEAWKDKVLQQSGEDGRQLLSFMAVEAAVAASGGGQKPYEGLLWALDAVNYWPEYAKAHEVLGRLHLAMGKKKEALDELRTAIRLNAASDEPDPGISAGIEGLAEERGLSL